MRKLFNVLKVDYEDLLTILVEIQRLNNQLMSYNYNDVDSEPLIPNLTFGRRLDEGYHQRWRDFKLPRDYRSLA